MSDFAWGTKWREAVVDAVVWSHHSRLHSLALQALKQQPARSILRLLGLGLLLNENFIWSNSPNESTPAIAQEALTKWKLHAASSTERSKDAEVPGDAKNLPFNGLKAKSFLELVDVFASWMGGLSEVVPEPSIVRRASVAFAMRGSLIGGTWRASILLKRNVGRRRPRSWHC